MEKCRKFRMALSLFECEHLHEKPVLWDRPNILLDTRRWISGKSLETQYSVFMLRVSCIHALLLVRCDMQKCLQV